MKLINSGCIWAMLLLLIANTGFAQKAKNVSDRGEKETRTVRGCDYEVLKGLAEIVEVTKIKDKAESALGHDEYRVRFNFIPMEGGAILATLKDETFEFFLQSGYDKLPVGPKYLAHYHVRKGQKFAMQFLQNRNGSCNEKYVYESKGIPNDLFEASPEDVIEHKKRIAEEKLFKKESEVNGTAEPINSDINNTPNPNKIPDPVVEEPKKEEVKTDVVPVEEPKKEEVDPIETPKEETKISNLDEEALRKELEAKMRKEKGLDEEPLSMDSLRAKLEAEVRADEARKAEDAAKANAKTAVKNAKQQAKEEELRRKEEEKQKAESEKLRQAEIEAKKVEIEKELSTKIQAEADAKKRKEDALREQIAKEIRRGSCAYQEKVSGTIEIIAVDKIAEKDQSIFGYTEYEVKFKFRPDNYNDIAKKDRKVWDEIYTFKIDPKGKGANPSATYIRKNQVFKGQKYKGFAQLLESGICQAMMIYAPELPIDAAQVQ